MWSVDVELVAEWLTALDQSSYEQVVAALELRAERGAQLGRPLVEPVVGTSSEHEGVAARIGRPFGVEGVVCVRP